MEVLEYHCPPCCPGGLPDDCLCGDLPSTLYATPSNAATCPCAASGTTIELTYNGVSNRWEGSGPLCGKTVTLKFLCDNGDPTEFACVGAPSAAGRLEVSWNPSCHTTQDFTATSCVCEDGDITYTFLTTAIGCCALPIQDGILWTVTN